MTITERIKESRQKANLSQTKLAELIGVSRAAISQWETGGENGTRPDGENLLKCAAALGVDPHWLQFGERSAHPIPGMKPAIIRLFPLLKDSDVEPWLINPLLTSEHRTIEMALLIKRISDRAFLYEVIGNAMLSPHNIAESLVPGEFALIDPDRTPVVGELVLAQIEKDDIRVRQYQADGKNAYLKAFDNSLPSIVVNDTVKILGVVVATYRFRLANNDLK